MENQAPLQEEASFQTDEESKFVDKRRSNLKSDLIEITEDKLENILLKHLEKIGIKKSWITPLSLFLTVLLANITATFGEKLGISAPVWEALFLLASIASGFWLLFSIFKIYSCWQEASLKNLIDIIKNSKQE